MHVVYYLSTRISASQRHVEPVFTGEQFLDLMHDLLRVQPGQPVGLFDVAVGDDGNDIIVLFDKALRQPVVIRLVVKPEHAPSLIQQAVKQAGEVGIAAGFGDGGMEGRIGGDHRQRILRLNGGCKFGLMSTN